MSKSIKHSRWDDQLIEGFLRLLDHLQQNGTWRQRRQETTYESRKKFLGYYQLLDLFKEEQCPVCAIIHESLSHYFSTSFVEEINRAEFREPLRQSLGYCRRHSEYLRRFITKKRYRLGIAILYEDILAQVVEWHMAPKATRLGSDSPALHSEQCPACNLEHEIEAYAAQLVADYLHDNEFQKQFRRSSGVCLPHLRAIAAKTKNDSARRFLFEAAVNHLSRTEHDIQELIRKNDYRFAGEKITKEEAASWQRAVHFFIGE
jgi:hypothetical protein